jgi:hypothetical protein
VSKFDQYINESSKFDSKCLKAHKEGQQAYKDGKRNLDNPYGSAGSYPYTDEGILQKNWSNGWNFAWLAHDRKERERRHPEAMDKFSKITSSYPEKK